MGFVDAIFDPVLGPLLGLPPVVTLLIVSVVVSLLSVLAQKYLTDQKRMKFLKAETKKLQTELKSAKGDPQKQLKIQNKMMPHQLELMKLGFKPAIYTMLPFLLLFLWLVSNIGYQPLVPGAEFSLTATVEKEVGFLTVSVPEGLELLDNATQAAQDGAMTWHLRGQAGAYVVNFFTRAEDAARTDVQPIATKRVIVSERKYAAVDEKFSLGVKAVKLGNQPMRPLGSFTIFGWHPHWLFVYIVFQILISIGLKKLFDVV